MDSKIQHPSHYIIGTTISSVTFHALGVLHEDQNQNQHSPPNKNSRTNFQLTPHSSLNLLIFDHPQIQNNHT